MYHTAHHISETVPEKCGANFIVNFGRSCLFSVAGEIKKILKLNLLSIVD